MVLKKLAGKDCVDVFFRYVRLASKYLALICCKTTKIAFQTNIQMHDLVYNLAEVLSDENL